MQVRDLNHVALHVSDVERSRKFYGETLGFSEKDRPDFDFDGAWYALGESSELHLLADRVLPVHSGPRGGHFAMEVEDIEAVASELLEKGVSFDQIHHRPDGARQIFCEDPDGHWVEFAQVPKSER